MAAVSGGGMLFALGLMAKPMLVTLPAVLLLLDYWPLRRFPQPRLGISSWKKIPLVLLSAVSCALTLIAQAEPIKANLRLSFSWRLANAADAYAGYLLHFFYPLNLAAFYPHLAEQLPPARIAAGVLVLAAITAVAVACRRKHPYLVVGWLWYLGMLIPVIGLVQVGRQAMADRYTYLPQMGVVIALVWGGDELADPGIGGPMSSSPPRFSRYSAWRPWLGCKPRIGRTACPLWKHALNFGRQRCRPRRCSARCFPSWGRPTMPCGNTDWP